MKRRQNEEIMIADVLAASKRNSNKAAGLSGVVAWRHTKGSRVDEAGAENKYTL